MVRYGQAQAYRPRLSSPNNRSARPRDDPRTPYSAPQSQFKRRRIEQNFTMERSDPDSDHEDLTPSRIPRMPRKLFDLRQTAIQAVEHKAEGYPSGLILPRFPSSLTDSEHTTTHMIALSRETAGTGYDIPEPCPREGNNDNPYANGGCQTFKLMCHLAYIKAISASQLTRVLDWLTHNGIPLAQPIPSRPTYLRGAVILHTRGNTVPNEDICDACRQHKGPFASCVVGPSTQKGRAESGACTCCIWNGKPAECTLLSRGNREVSQTYSSPQQRPVTPGRRAAVLESVTLPTPSSRTPHRRRPSYDCNDIDRDAVRRLIGKANKNMQKHNDLRLQQMNVQNKLQNYLLDIEKALGL